MSQCTLRLTSAELTDVGHRRERNEDAILSIPEHGVFCVADGMGGAVDGHEASGQIVLSVEAAVRTAEGAPMPKIVEDAIHEANLAVYNYAKSRNSLGMGSTVVTLVVDLPKGHAQVIHAGDSRAYRLRKGHLKRLTRDHTVAAEIGLDTEGRAPTFLDSMLTRAIGLGEHVDLVVSTFDVHAGDRFLLCSDGLNRHLGDREVGDLLDLYPEQTIEEIVAELVDLTKRRGAIDNVSVIAVALDEAKD